MRLKASRPHGCHEDVSSTLNAKHRRKHTQRKLTGTISFQYSISYIATEYPTCHVGLTKLSL